jgi:hypothetical protein
MTRPFLSHKWDLFFYFLWKFHDLRRSSIFSSLGSTCWSLDCNPEPPYQLHMKSIFFSPGITSYWQFLKWLKVGGKSHSWEGLKIGLAVISQNESSMWTFSPTSFYHRSIYCDKMTWVLCKEEGDFSKLIIVIMTSACST